MIIVALQLPVADVSDHLQLQISLLHKLFRLGLVNAWFDMYPTACTDILFCCSATFDPDTIASRLRELAFLNNAATIRFKADKPGGKAKASTAQTNGSSAASSSDSSDEESDSSEGWQVFHFSEGLKEYVKWVNSDRQAFHEPIVISREVHTSIPCLHNKLDCSSCGLLLNGQV